MIVWDFESKRQLYNLFGMKHQVTFLAFTADDRFLVGTGSDKMLFVWDMEARGCRVVSLRSLAHVCVCVHVCVHVRNIAQLMNLVLCAQTGEQVYGKGQNVPVNFVAWGAIETVGRRNKYTLSFGVGRDVRRLPPSRRSHTTCASQIAHNVVYCDRCRWV